MLRLIPMLVLAGCEPISDITGVAFVLMITLWAVANSIDNAVDKIAEAIREGKRRDS